MGVDAADDRFLRRDPAGGHRGLRAGPARAAIAVLHARAIFSAAGKRSASLPVARHGVSRPALAGCWKQAGERFGAQVAAVLGAAEHRNTRIRRYAS